ncbi:MAG: GDP-mannose 4,6-dehydratase [Candidatus Bathyarchaeota archaeon]|nr:MAG: GDP-mannose 4,6-dehydratase [Candidatus Bathyarchaeota archaeon]
MKRVLVTGGAGFIGSHLVEKLVSLSHDVTVLDDLSNGDLEKLRNVRDAITFLKHDISKRTRLEGLDAIYHLACFPRSRSFQNPQRDVEVNVVGMINVLELARRNNAKVVFSSNSGIYDTSRIPIDEHSPDKPKTPYDLDKLQAEQYMKLYGDTFAVKSVIFRFATVFGDRQSISPEWKPVVMEFISKLQKEQKPTIYWDGEQTRDFIHVDDIVEALLLALESDGANGETMILGSGSETSINELYHSIGHLLKTSIEPTRKPKQLGDIRRMRYNCAKAEKILGWKPRISLDEGLRRTISSTQNVP